MSLKNTFNKAAATIFSAIGDIKQSITYKQYVSDAYNPTTGSHTASYTDHSIQAFVEEYKTQRIDGSIIDADYKLMILKADLDIGLSAKDRVVIGGIEYKVIKYSLDATHSIHTVYVKL